MEKLVFKTITEKEEKDLVLDKIEHHTGVRLPELYVSQSKIVGTFLQEKLVAGYMLVTRPDYRSLLFVPDEIKKSHKFFSNDTFEMMEVNGLWIGPSLRKPSQQLRVWAHLIIDVFLCKKKYVLLMRNTKNKSMERFMNMSLPSEIYQGPPSLMAGEKTHNSIQVSYTTRWKLMMNAHKYLGELVRRQYKTFNSSKTRKSVRGIEQSQDSFA